MSPTRSNFTATLHNMLSRNMVPVFLLGVAVPASIPSDMRNRASSSSVLFVALVYWLATPAGPNTRELITSHTASTTNTTSTAAHVSCREIQCVYAQPNSSPVSAAATAIPATDGYITYAPHPICHTSAQPSAPPGTPSKHR